MQLGGTHRVLRAAGKEGWETRSLGQLWVSTPRFFVLEKTSRQLETLVMKSLEFPFGHVLTDDTPLG